MHPAMNFEVGDDTGHMNASSNATLKVVGLILTPCLMLTVPSGSTLYFLLL